MAFGTSGSLYTLTVSNSAVGIGAGNIPSGSNYAMGHVRDATAVFTTDGTTPTTTVGTRAHNTEDIALYSRSEITGFSGIREASTDVKIDWTFFNSLPHR